MQLTRKIKQASKDISSPSKLTAEQIVSRPQISKPPIQVVQSGQVVEEEQLRQAGMIPIIDPVKSDLTEVLRLKGTAAPNSYVLLFLNGYRVSNIIQVSSTGHWSYETDVKPGEYTVQIIDDRNLTESQKLKVVVPAKQVQTQTTKPGQVKNKQKLSHQVSKPQAKQTLRTQPDTVILNQHAGNREHVVEPGDTLFDLSVYYHVTVSEITRANNISEQDLLLVDQLLIIPEPSQ